MDGHLVYGLTFDFWDALLKNYARVHVVLIYYV
jgi:hypothetical protein